MRFPVMSACDYVIGMCYANWYMGSCLWDRDGRGTATGFVAGPCSAPSMRRLYYAAYYVLRRYEWICGGLLCCGPEKRLSVDLANGRNPANLHTSFPLRRQHFFKYPSDTIWHPHFNINKPVDSVITNPSRTSTVHLYWRTRFFEITFSHNFGALPTTATRAPENIFVFQNKPRKTGCLSFYR